jgi:hypothetical protein
MTADEVLATVASRPSADWLKIQAGRAEMVASRFSRDEISEIRAALAEAEAEFERGEAMEFPPTTASLGTAPLIRDRDYARGSCAPRTRQLPNRVGSFSPVRTDATTKP